MIENDEVEELEVDAFADADDGEVNLVVATPIENDTLPMTVLPDLSFLTTETGTVEQAHDLKELLIDLMNQSRRTFLDIGELLFYYREARLYRRLGFEKFKDFLEQPGIEIKEDTAVRFMNIYRTYVIEFEIDKQRLESIDYTKLDVAAKHLTEENKEQMLHNAQNMSIRELKALLTTTATREEQENAENGIGQDIKTVVKLTISRAMIRRPDDETEGIFRFTTNVTIMEKDSEGRVLGSTNNNFISDEIITDNTDGNVGITLTTLEPNLADDDVPEVPEDPELVVVRDDEETEEDPFI